MATDESKAAAPELSPLEERDAVKSIIENTVIAVGQTWYIVSFKWWQKWCDYSAYNEKAGATRAGESPSKSGEASEVLVSGLEAERPGPMDNNDILGDSPEELLKGIQEQYDYVALPASAYEKLFAWYGGGPAIARSVIGRGRLEQAFIEMYPLRFHVVKADREGKEPCLTERDRVDPTSGLCQSFLFSRGQTPEEALAEICTRMRSDKARSRLWSRPANSQQDWVLVGAEASNLADLCGGEGSLSLLLEIRLGETWPRDVVEEGSPVDPHWRLALKAGDLLDAQDKQEGKWYESNVVSVRGDVVRVHFKGWSDKWDEDINRKTEAARLEPLHTKVMGLCGSVCVVLPCIHFPRAAPPFIVQAWHAYLFCTTLVPAHPCCCLLPTLVAACWLSLHPPPPINHQVLFVESSFTVWFVLKYT